MKNSEGYFKTRLSFEPSRDKIWKVIAGYLQRYIPEDAVILELGAGYCSFINNIKAAEKHALDVSDIIKKYAADDIRIHIKDCRNLKSFKTGYFDVVFSSFLYEHLTRHNLDQVMKQLRRIIKKNGILMTLLPNFKYIYKHYFDDYTHIQIFTHVSFADYIVSHGFEVTVNEGRFIPYSFKSKFPKSALLTRLYLMSPWHPFAGNMLVIARNPDILTPPPPKKFFKREKGIEREENKISSRQSSEKYRRKTYRTNRPRRKSTPNRPPRQNSS